MGALFWLSRYVGLTSPDPQHAVHTYAAKLGMEPVPHHIAEVQAGPLHFCIDPGDPAPPVLELMTPRLAEARPALRARGFTELVWKGVGETNLVADPFGNKWNVYQHDPADDDFPEEHPNVLPKIGLIHHRPHDVAHFYAALFEAKLSQRGTAFIIDSGPIRLRVQSGLPEGPTFWLHPDFDIGRLTDGPTKSYVIDDNKVCWRHADATDLEYAVVDFTEHA